MLGGGGSMQNMQVMLRNNKNLGRKNSLFKRRLSYTDIKAKLNKLAEGKVLHEMSEVELQDLRKKLVNEKRKNLIILTTLALIFTVLISYSSHQFITSFESSKNIEKEKKEEKKLKEKFNFYITDGDEWLVKEHYKNAIFQYKLAVETYPLNFEARYRLALAYTYRCQFENLDCDEAKLQVFKLNAKFPDNTDLLVLNRQLNRKLNLE